MSCQPHRALTCRNARLRKAIQLAAKSCRLHKPHYHVDTTLGRWASVLVVSTSFGGVRGEVNKRTFRAQLARRTTPRDLVWMAEKLLLTPKQEKALRLALDGDARGKLNPLARTRTLPP